MNIDTKNEILILANLKSKYKWKESAFSITARIKFKNFEMNI